uniref:Uncharacterized protein n=1 Tax=Zooxanthella nutricula TaxID=1333877 RepID=A0A7S2QBV6_9DINO|mmetsp:Transcript_84847/g.259030  ORF Transcript_84847/g.259030 Transcript_84847/m.259030 type:complete len:394 (+) Transcript_84847:91-1272(+)
MAREPQRRATTIECLPRVGKMNSMVRGLTFEDAPGAEIAGDMSPWSKSSVASVNSSMVESVSFDDMSLDGDVYGFTIKSFIRETYKLSVGLPCCHRVLRLVSAFGILWVNIAIQGGLIYSTKQFVSAKSVHTMRELYDKYEMHMYTGGNGSHFVTAKGYRRGRPDFFRPAFFDTLDADTKGQVCFFPLSRPDLASLILFIWTLTCVGEIRKTQELFVRLIWSPFRETHRFVRVRLASTDDGQEYFVLQGFGWWAKAAILVLVLIPRLVITCILLELGSRWLLSTNDFQALMVNSVALSFIKDMKDLVFNTIVSSSDKREVELTRVALSDTDRVQRTTLRATYKAMSWGVGTAAFVLSYIYCFQQVLPDYQWDVASVCQPWVAEHYFREFRADL